MAILQFSIFSLLLAGSTSLVSAIAAPSLEERTPQDCVAAGSIVDSCAAATSGFLQLSNNEQATCFCRDANGNYDPAPFEMAASGCYDFLRTAQPGLASEYGSTVVGACSKFGAPTNAAAAAGTTTATASSTPPSSTVESPKITGMGSTSSLAGSGPMTTTGGAGNTQTSPTATGSPTATATAVVKSGANKAVMLSSGLWLGVLSVLALVV